MRARSKPFILALALAAMAVALATPSPAAAQEIKINQCLVDLIEQRDVPAQEAGMLLTLEPREGANVDAGARLGTIDDREAAAEREVAARELEVAREQATNDVNVRFADKSMRVAWYEYQQNVQANDRVKGTVSMTEILRSKFAWERAALQIEQAKHEMKVAELQAQAAQAKLNAAQVKVDRRQIMAPISGMVTDIYRKPGTWVNPGDPVLRVIYLERLRVKGRLNAKEYTPSEMAGRPVSVTVDLPGGPATFSGKIVFANPEVDATTLFEVWAEIDNKLVDGAWQLGAGWMCDMTIDMTGARMPARPSEGNAAMPPYATPPARRTAEAPRLP